MGNFIDLTGKNFEFLTVIERSFEKNIVRRVSWRCVCKCGKETIVLGSNLKGGHVKSCGCLNYKPKNLKHGMRYSSEYNSWRGMKKRCYQQSHKSFINYGGRGIKVCDRWLNSFENFYEDMGNKPSLKHSIDRIDVNGDYEPNNCRWATHSEQNLNKRKK